MAINWEQIRSAANFKTGATATASQQHSTLRQAKTSELMQRMRRDDLMVALTETSECLEAVSSPYEDGQQNNGAPTTGERVRRGGGHQPMSERPTNEYVLVR